MEGKQSEPLPSILSSAISYHKSLSPLSFFNFYFWDANVYDCHSRTEGRGVVRGGGGARDVLGGTKCGGPEAGGSLALST